MDAFKRSIRSSLEIFRLYARLNQLSLKAFSVRIAIVSSNVTLVNKDDTSYDINQDITFRFYYMYK